MRFYREFLGNHVIQFVSFLSIVGILLTVKSFQGYLSLILLIAGALVYAFAEYIVHRYILHEFPKLFSALYREHVEHHRNPNDIKYLFSPVYYDFLIYFIYVTLLWSVFRDFSYIAPMATGTLLFQLYYQWMHYAAHRPVAPRTVWGRWMKKKHLLHHFQDEHTWYGVSHPTLDFVMQTDKSKGSVQEKK
ncbi:sterol desaturase family protein [Paenibacillus glucanolyticus]|uniref:sterol desaturase family protein n=1 Tax=Paenibacillus glucanolyticus TaxID=59843 RepID=UPI00188385D8|nr:sterol desaturase family protein [Paenibacillus glucanolyticus]